MAEKYYAILTDQGKVLEAAAIATGSGVSLTQFVVGDGGGNEQIPDATRTELVNECYRGQITSLAVSPDQDNQIMASLAMPSGVGGFTIREVGLLTAQGELYAIASCAAIEKPVEGVAVSLTFRLVVSDADAVSLIIADGEGVFLRQSKNLADIPDVAIARDNLGLGSAAVLDVGQEAGTVAAGDDERFRFIGQCPDIETLRATEPAIQRQQIYVREYAKGSGRGGGTFVYQDQDTATVDDGGYYIVTAGGARWKRDITPEMLNVQHYGAVMDGVTDDMPAVKRMYNGTRNLSTANTVGIRIPAGKIALSSSFDESASAEQSVFRLKGPDVEYGVSPIVQVYFLDAASSTPVFQVNARRTDISGLKTEGAGTVTPFFKNVCPAGQYYRVKAFRCDDNGGPVFDVMDTIDTKFDQIYGYRLAGGFLKTRWSNTVAGGWDHATAIELSNSNFTSCTSTDVISAIRATQSIMRNVWFSSNEYTFDLSQGGWLLDTVIVEASTYPAKTQYAKLQEINCRYEQGATKDNTLSGYTSDMDDGNDIPSWVVNGYDQGAFNLNATGSVFSAGLGAGFHYPTTILENGNSAETWFYVGRMNIPALGRTAIVRFTGASGWDSATRSITAPGATNFGSGEARVFLEMKQPNAETTSAVEAHWHGEANCPINDVRIVHNWQFIYLYVKVAQYARYVGVFMETNALPRAKTSTPFYFLESNTQITDIDTVENLVTAPCRWTVNKGRYDGNGFGMDMDSGDLLLYSTSLQGVAGAHYLTAYVNGELRYLPIYEHTGSVRMPRYAYVDLPSAVTHVYGMVLCTDTTMTPTMQPLYSDGEYWYPVSDPEASWKPS